MNLISKNIILKNLSFLIKIRIINILALIFAMYISAIFLFNGNLSITEILKNIKLHGIILSSMFSVMAGYIINHFYDQEKDSLYRPITTTLQHFIKQKEALNIYILFNIISLSIALMLSFRILIFFLIYQFLIWFYSHKLSKIVLINNIISSILMIFPFLALFLFYENFSTHILYLSIFLFLMILIRDICKDIHSHRFDNLFNYNTLPNTLGLIPTKLILDILLFILAIVSYSLSINPHMHEIRLYYLLSCCLSIFVAFFIWFIERRRILFLVLMIKFWIFVGSFSLFFIDNNHKFLLF